MMNSEAFCTRFKLSPYQPLQPVLNHTKLRQAAVLIAVTETPDGLAIILTKRASHLKHHPGQISFPGGKVEPEDNQLSDTALRESFEEIALPASHVKIIGQLSTRQSIAGFSVTPFVGLVTKPFILTIDQQEVSEVIHLPLSHLLDSKNRQQVVIERFNRKIPIHFIPYQQHMIWGLTAGFLADLALHLG